MQTTNKNAQQKTNSNAAGIALMELVQELQKTNQYKQNQNNVYEETIDGITYCF